jgi:hypothetical protein
VVANLSVNTNELDHNVKYVVVVLSVAMEDKDHIAKNVAAALFVAMEKENQHVKNVRNDEAFWHVQYLISSKLIISDPSNALLF